MTTQCAVCGKPVKAKRKTKKTCSAKCRQQYSRTKTKLLLAQVPADKYIAAGKRAPKEYVVRRENKFGSVGFYKIYGEPHGVGYNTIHWCTSFDLKDAEEIVKKEKAVNPGCKITAEKISDLRGLLQ